MVSGCCCKELTIIINFPTPLVSALFLAAASLLLCSFFKCFFVLYNYTRQRLADCINKRTGALIANVRVYLVYQWAFIRVVLHHGSVVTAGASS